MGDPGVSSFGSHIILIHRKLFTDQNCLEDESLLKAVLLSLKSLYDQIASSYVENKRSILANMIYATFSIDILSS